MHARHLLVGLSALLLLAAACGTPESTAPVVPLAALPAAAPAAAQVPAAGPETVVVATVDDGDTFTLTDGRKVRVLGIDSCETSTRAGRSATTDASALIDGRTVTLRPETGVDRDPFGRLLRYVAVPDGRDFGTLMVVRSHTGVYEGGDAAPSYVAALRAADDGPMACGTAAAPTSTAAPQPVRRAVPTAAPASRTAAPSPAPKPAPKPASAPAPKPAPKPQPAVGSGCHPSYTPCVPNGPDLDCPDIGHPVRVVGPDSFRLDADKDGVGCE